MKKVLLSLITAASLVIAAEQCIASGPIPGSDAVSLVTGSHLKVVACAAEAIYTIVDANGNTVGCAVPTT